MKTHLPRWKRNLQLFATTAYLAAAFVITAATSKGRPGDYSGSLNAFGGTANYTMESDCPNHPDVRALHVKMGKIKATINSTGSVAQAENIDFRAFGFPQPIVVVGLDQYSTDASSPQKCVVRTKSSHPDVTYDASKTKYFFIQPGSLTKVVYDCTTSSAQCTTTLEELPALPFRKLNLSQKTTDGR